MMTRTRQVTVLLLLLLLAAATVVSAEAWRLDPRRSRLEFMPTYEGRPTVGQFRDFRVQLRLDPARPEEGQLRVTVSLMSADLSSGDINRAIRGSDWLDVARYPRAEFVSSQIAGSKGRYVAEGRLTLKGATQAIEVPFAWQTLGNEARMSGQLQLDRTAFHIGTGEWADGRTIARPVEVRFDLYLEPGE